MYGLKGRGQTLNEQLLVRRCLTGILVVLAAGLPLGAQQRDWGGNFA
jgi:hypothetical protein